uniref:Uncharacterized protein n=1 Tax=Rhizophora mucronata TaxID=61149 RepID=A0A2P2MRM8_RHIMU
MTTSCSSGDFGIECKSLSKSLTGASYS